MNEEEVYEEEEKEGLIERLSRAVTMALLKIKSELEEEDLKRTMKRIFKGKEEEEVEEERVRRDVTNILNAVMRHLRSAKHLLGELTGEEEMEGYEFYGFITDITEDLDSIIDEVSYIMESYVESR